MNVKTPQLSKSLAGRGARFWLTPRLGSLVIGIALAIVLLSGLAARYSAPSAPIYDRDTWTYLSPSAHLLASGQLVKSYRSFPYPATLYVILATFHNFTAITFFQAILGMLGGWFLWLSWLKLKEWFPFERAGLDLIWQAMGVVMLFGYLVARSPIILEHTIRPESTFPFLAALQLYLSLSYLSAAFKGGHRKKSGFFCAGLVFVSLLMYLWRPNWALALPFSVAPVAAVWWYQPLPRFKTVLAAFTGAALFLLLFWVPEAVLTHKFCRKERPFVPSLLLSIHAKPIRKVVADELEGRAPSPYDKALLKEVQDALDYAFSGPPEAEAYPSLGFDPDYLLYRSPILNRISSVLGSEHFPSFCFHFYLQAWRRYPSDMAGKILTEMHLFYGTAGKEHTPGRGRRVSVSQRYNLKSRYEQASTLLSKADPAFTQLPLVRRYAEALDQLKTKETILKQPKRLVILVRAIDSSYIFVLGAYLVFACVGLLTKRLKEFRPIILLGLWCFSFNFGMTLTTSVVHSMKIGRYTEMQYQFTVFSFFAAGAIMVLLAIQKLVPKASGEGSAPAVSK